MMEKRCNQCGEIKPCTEFYTNGKLADGSTSYRPECKECHKRKKRIPLHLQKRKNFAPPTDEVWIRCKRMAYDARARVLAPSRKYKTTYQGLKNPFGFSSSGEMARFLYKEFKSEIQALLDAGKIPSVDRIDSSVGYTPENIRIIDFKENTLRGVENRKSPVRVTYPDGTTSEFDSVKAVADEFGTNESHVRGWLKGKWAPKNGCKFEYIAKGRS